MIFRFSGEDCGAVSSGGDEGAGGGGLLPALSLPWRRAGNFIDRTKDPRYFRRMTYGRGCRTGNTGSMN